MNDYFLADDLSGALDAAAAFHHAGRRVTIALSTDTWPEAGPDDVVGFTTETRNAPPEAAARAVMRAIERGRERGGRLLYKKIDSTLRGPVAAEVAALMAALPEVRVLFAPANPRVERSVRDGRLLVRGVPVAETEFGRDPVCPVRESSIRALLGVTANERVDIPDTATEADLQAAVARMDAAGSPWVPVGSGALARPVAAREAVVTRPGNAGNSTPATGPILMIGGSAHPGNRAQAARLTEVRGVPTCDVVVADMERTVAGALWALRERGSVSLLAPAERMGAADALRAIVTAGRQVITRGEVTRVFVTGGETAFALAGALGIPAFEICAEIEAGLVLARSGGAANPMSWAVKPGGFGDRETWVRAFDALQRAG